MQNPDRRPSGVYSPYGGQGPGRNQAGLDNRWVATPAERMAFAEDFLDRAKIGKRWVHMPHGAADDPNIYACTVAETLPNAVADYFEYEFERGGHGWGLYLGRAMPTNDEPDSLYTAPENRMAVSNRDAAFVVGQIGPFLDAGFTMFGFDAASDEEGIRLVHGPIRARLPQATALYVEAVPMVQVGTGDGPGGILYAPNHALLERTPVVVLDSTLQNFDRAGEWWVDPHHTQVEAWMDTTANADRAKDLYRRGFIPGPFVGVTPDDVLDWIANAPNNR